MPQKKSYFALQLPKRWWIFGLDLALHCDIDVYQFKFFAELVKEKVISTLSLIVMICCVADWLVYRIGDADFFFPSVLLYNLY